MPVSLVHIIADTPERLRALDRFGLDLKPRLAQTLGPGRYTVPGILTEEEIAAVEKEGYGVQVRVDLEEVARARAAEVSPVNRFADARGALEFDRRAVLGYMTAAEVQSAISNLAVVHSDLVTLVPLPHPTWEGRTCQAVRLRAGTGGPRTGVLVTGSVHAREWGGSEICLTLLNDLITAYRAGGGLSYGGKTFTADQVRTILERLDLYVFPDVNPDGKNHSQTMDPGSGLPSGFWWRKNRNPNTATGGAQRGVDLNRNFDFLWGSGIGTSTSPGSAVYRGTAAFSEPETRNVRHLFETYPEIRYYVDIHSYGELILYSWGDDDNQTGNPVQNFKNPLYDGQRGIPQDLVYREFIPSLDEQTAVNLAKRMNQALSAVRGRSYTVKQAVGLYPTSATSDDYAFSRHVTSGLARKVYAYTIEFGTEFVPPIAEMRNVIADVGAALAELCWAVNSDVYLRDNASDTGTVPSAGPFWNCPDIWVRNADDGGAIHQNTIRGQDNFIYVRVGNRGQADATDVRVRVLLASFAGTEFVHPADWVPRNPAGGGSLSGPGTYLVGEAVIASVAPATTQNVSVRWPSALIPPELQWHPCLLVEVSPNDGPAPAGPQVWENNNLAQKNVTIVNARRGARIDFPFRIGSAAASAGGGALVLRRVKGPPSVGVYLDLDDPLLLDAYATTIAGTEAPEPPAGAVVATLLKPMAVLIPLSLPGLLGQNESLMLRLPEQTRVSALGSAGEAGPKQLAQDIAGFELVTVADRPFLGLKAPVEGRIPLNLKPTETKEMAVTLTIPDDAVAGDSYEYEVVQYGPGGRPVGGIVLQVMVT